MAAAAARKQAKISGENIMAAGEMEAKRGFSSA
jgi:hypothetical protein